MLTGFSPYRPMGDCHRFGAGKAVKGLLRGVKDAPGASSFVFLCSLGGVEFRNAVFYPASLHGKGGGISSTRV